MKNLILLLALFSLFSCENKEELHRLQLASTKLEVLDVHKARIYEVNSAINNDSSALMKAKLFSDFNDTLDLIQNELIGATGGLQRDGHYINLPAKEYVFEYFYGETYFRNNSHEFFFHSLDNFILRLEKLYPESKFKERLEKRLKVLNDHYGIEAREDIFKDLTINEAVNLLNSFQNHVAIEQTEYLIKVKNGS